MRGQSAAWGALLIVNRRARASRTKHRNRRIQPLCDGSGEQQRRAGNRFRQDRSGVQYRCRHGAGANLAKAKTAEMSS
jgi:hypothetical protein